MSNYFANELAALHALTEKLSSEEATATPIIPESSFDLTKTSGVLALLDGLLTEAREHKRIAETLVSAGHEKVSAAYDVNATDVSVERVYDRMMEKASEAAQVVYDLSVSLGLDPEVLRDHGAVEAYRLAVSE